MKKLFIIAISLLVSVAMLMTACKKDETNNGNNNGNNGGGGTTSVQWVDLDLPSGLLWADRNVGASSPELYGNYYAWGEITRKEVYNWSTYAYSNGNDQLTKYCTKPENGLNGFTDNLTILEASDDAATVNIGGGARTPTKEEWQELMDYTVSVWTTRNGVYGRLLTASNGNSIFLPAAGGRYDSNFSGAGEYGFYWSSSLREESPRYAWRFRLDSEESNFQDVYFNDRYRGFPVRAVRAR